MERRTKIVCTLGPASSSEETIRNLILAGMDVARLNFSHGSHDYHRGLIETVRRVAEEENRQIAILQDLQGPKLRVGLMKNGSVELEAGQKLTITAEPLKEGTKDRIHVSYPTLFEDIKVGGEILLDDGNLELVVTGFEGRDVITEVVVGGPLSSRKGVNLPNILTSTPALTTKDFRDLEFGLAMKVDIVALSFVRDPSDVKQLVDRIRKETHQPMVIAKIEKPEALESIDEIIAISEGIMVARGDLGIEMRLSKVPAAQKRIISKSRRASKPVITATQMLESMIENARPTRAEVSDVANAVLDGSDALMLSGETAVGAHPVKVVEVMSRIIIEAEKVLFDQQITRIRSTGNPTVTEAVSQTAYFIAHEVNAKAIVCLTSSGSTARFIARHRPHVPLYAFTDDKRILGQLALSWGTKGFYFPFQSDTDKGIELVHNFLKEQGLASAGDIVVMTAGMPLPAKGRTNMLHVSIL
ncbi:pyruvate kinase [bacterium]|nr:pyruvate kinase [bacterium]